MPAASGTAAAQPSFQHSKPKPHTSVPGQAKQKQEDLAWTRTTGLWAPASSALPRSSGIASRDTRETSVSWCNHSGSTATEFENTPGKVFRVFGLDSILAEGQLSLHQLQWHNANSCGPDWRAPSIMPSLDHP